MTAADRIVRNSAFNLTGQAVYAVFHLLAIVVMARQFGAGMFGEYYIVFALTLVVQLVAEAGLGTILTRRLVRTPDQHVRIVGEATSLFVLSVVLSVAALTTIGLALAWWRADAAVILVFAIAGIACAGLQVQRLCVGVLQGKELFGYENVARVLQGATFALLVLMLAWRGAPSLAVVVSMLAASHWLSAVFLLATSHQLRVLSRPSFPVRWQTWVAEAGPVGVGDVIRGVTWQLDTVLLGLLQPAAVVGIYSIAYRPLGPLNWLPRAVLAASFPSLTRVADDPAALDRAFARSTRLLAIISIPIVAVVFVFADVFVRLIAGAEYAGAAVPLRILIWVAVISYLTMHFRYVMAATSQQRTYAALAAGVLVLEAVIELALIPRWGYLGACAGTLAGEIVFAVAGLALCRRGGIQSVEWPQLARAALAGAAIVPVLWIVRTSEPLVLAATAAMAAALYFALCVWFGAIERHEVRQFTGAFLRLLRPAPRAAWDAGRR